MHASMSCVMVQGAGQAPRGGSVLCEPSPTRQACPSPGPESPRSPESRGLHLGSRRADWEGGQEEVAGGSGDVPPDPVLLGLPGGPMLLLLWGAAPRPHPADPRGARPTHPPPCPPPHSPSSPWQISVLVAPPRMNSGFFTISWKNKGVPVIAMCDWSGLRVSLLSGSRGLFPVSNSFPMEGARPGPGSGRFPPRGRDPASWAAPPHQTTISCHARLQSRAMN